MNSLNSVADQLRVLIIDDHAVMRKIIRRLLKESGIMHVAEAANGRKALAYLCDPECENPDVIICDLYMDEMSGTEFLHKLRRNKTLSTRKVPVIVLTGESDEMVQDVARQVGANSVMQKPVSKTDLRFEIEAVVGCQLDPMGTIYSPNFDEETAQPLRRSA